MPSSLTLAKRPMMLIVRDGWGCNPHPEMDTYNAVKLAGHPVDDRLMAEYPSVLVHTSGEWVGLPDGVMGNSEVGHQNIGAGRIVDQETMRITRRIREGSFFQNAALNKAFSRAMDMNSRVHILGLCSDGRVHSDLEHAYAILELAGRVNFPSDRVFIHAITDGRDTAPQGARKYLAGLEAKTRELGIGRIASVVGRYYAMDRDNRWERVEQAYNAIVCGQGELRASAHAALEQSYAAGVNDEFVVPVVVAENATVNDGDGFIFFNFRSDRAREITRAIALDGFDGFKRRCWPRLSGYVCLTEYDATFGLPIAFASTELTNILGGVLADAGLRQLRIAETEKYAHVTFFFNGGVETPFPGEDRALIPSPKEVATYDLKPEMSAFAVTDELLARIDSGVYDVIILNFANCDMVGHTGIEAAAIKAVEAVDACAGRVVAKVQEKGGAVLITADHGNAEQMQDENGEPFTAHTTNPVWLVLVDDSRKGAKLREGGRLADIAPTMLQMLGIAQPGEMTGESLL